IYVFFQAEDGIRDRNVTGVQTCALPILRWWCRGATLRSVLPRRWGGCPTSPGAFRLPYPCWGAGKSLIRGKIFSPIFMPDSCVRSEERRVGKEWGWQWLQHLTIDKVMAK